MDIPFAEKHLHLLLLCRPYLSSYRQIVPGLTSNLQDIMCQQFISKKPLSCFIRNKEVVFCVAQLAQSGTNY